MGHRRGLSRTEMLCDIRDMTEIPFPRMDKYPLEVIELLHTACMAARQVQRDKVLPRVRAACALIELGDQRLMAQDGPCGNQPPKMDVKEWHTMYVHLDLARAALETEGI